MSLTVTWKPSVWRAFVFSKASATAWDTVAEISMRRSTFSKGMCKSKASKVLALGFGWCVAQRLSEVGDPGEAVGEEVILTFEFVGGWTCKDQLGLERHGARTLPGLGARIGLRLLTLAAGIWHNHLIGERALAAYGR